MTAARFIDYELLLTAYGFKTTTPPHRLSEVTQSPNWQRDTQDKYEISRVFLYHDGTFRAYRNDGEPVAHGSSPDELRGCFPVDKRRKLA